MASGSEPEESKRIRSHAYRGQWPQALELLRANPALATACGASGYTVFHQLGYHGASEDVMAEFVDAGANHSRAALASASRDGRPADVAESRGHVSAAVSLRLFEAAGAAAGGAVAAAAASDPGAPAAEPADEAGTAAVPDGIHDRILAAMQLAAVGDAVGYHDGAWEFNSDGVDVDRQMTELGGPLAIEPRCGAGWRVSDDTVQHLATLQALADHAGSLPTRSPTRGGDAAAFDRVMVSMAAHHVSSWSDMDGRAPGGTCRRGVSRLSAAPGRWRHVVPFSDQKNCGCGSCMRPMGIGLVFPGSANRALLVAFAAESAALSHHCVVGCITAVIAAAGCAYAAEGVPAAEWPTRFAAELVPMTKAYLKEREGGTGDVSAARVEAVFDRFLKPWLAHAADRSLRMKPAEAADAATRDARFASVGHGWAATGAALIAWDAFQACEAALGPRWRTHCDEGWEMLLRVSAAHGGDSDSTATMVGAWFGAMHGTRALEGRTGAQCRAVEYSDRMRELAGRLAGAAASP